MTIRATTHLLRSLVQHPYGETDIDKLDLPTNTGKSGYLSAYAIPTKDVEKVNFETVEQPLTDLEKATPNFGAITTTKTSATSTIEQRTKAAKDNLAALQAEAAAKAAEESAPAPESAPPTTSAPSTSSATAASFAVALIAAGAMML